MQYNSIERPPSGSGKLNSAEDSSLLLLPLPPLLLLLVVLLPLLPLRLSDDNEAR